jgi:polyferredoxin
MTDPLASLPRFPARAREELPPPRRRWGWLLFLGAMLMAGGLMLLLWSLASAWVFVLAPEALAVFGSLLGILALILLLVFVYAWQRSKEQER